MDPRALDKLEQFLNNPGDELPEWRLLWESDSTFPVRSHRPFLGKVVVGLKRLLRPLVRSPQADLWERERLFNLVVLSQVVGEKPLSSYKKMEWQIAASTQVRR